jgi:hypothetical protein
MYEQSNAGIILTLLINNNICAADGEWDVWSDWSTCRVSCGGGIIMRFRECIPPSNGGNDCSGSPIEVAECNTEMCPGKL